MYSNYNRSYAARVLRQRAKPKILGRLKEGDVTLTLVEDERTKLLESPFLSQQAKEELNGEYAKLNPVELQREMDRMQERLSELGRLKREVRQEEETRLLEYIFR